MEKDPTPCLCVTGITIVTSHHSYANNLCLSYRIGPDYVLLTTPPGIVWMRSVWVSVLDLFILLFSVSEHFAGRMRVSSRECPRISDRSYRGL